MMSGLKSLSRRRRARRSHWTSSGADRSPRTPIGTTPTPASSLHSVTVVGEAARVGPAGRNGGGHSAAQGIEGPKFAASGTGDVCVGQEDGAHWVPETWRARRHPPRPGVDSLPRSRPTWRHPNHHTSGPTNADPAPREILLAAIGRHGARWYRTWPKARRCWAIRSRSSRCRDPGRAGPAGASGRR